MNGSNLLGHLLLPMVHIIRMLVEAEELGLEPGTLRQNVGIPSRDLTAVPNAQFRPAFNSHLNLMSD